MNIESLLVIFTLLIAFQLKHMVVDFGVQGIRKDAMKKFNINGWVFPLLKHAMDQGIGTLIISLFAFVLLLPEISLLHIVGVSVLFAFFDFVVHFCIDRIKANYSRQLAVSDRLFWILIGTDQMMHHFTHYFIIAAMMIVVYV